MLLLVVAIPVYFVIVAGATTTVFVERASDCTVMLAFILFSLDFIDSESKEVDATDAVASPLFIGAALIIFGMAANLALLRRQVSVCWRHKGWVGRRSSARVTWNSKSSVEVDASSR